jgi:hypothetical protein
LWDAHVPGYAQSARLRAALAHDVDLRAVLERAARTRTPNATRGQGAPDPSELLTALGVERAQALALVETLLRSLAGDARTATQRYLFEQAVERALIARRTARLLALTPAQTEVITRAALLEVLGLQLLLRAPRPCACTLEALLARCAATGAALPARHPFMDAARRAAVQFARRCSLGEPLVAVLVGTPSDAQAYRSLEHRSVEHRNTARVLALTRELAGARPQVLSDAARARGVPPGTRRRA